MYSCATLSLKRFKKLLHAPTSTPPNSTCSSPSPNSAFPPLNFAPSRLRAFAVKILLPSSSVLTRTPNPTLRPLPQNSYRSGSLGHAMSAGSLCHRSAFFSVTKYAVVASVRSSATWSG